MPQLLKPVLMFMNKAERVSKLCTGAEKREFVLVQLQDFFGKTKFEEYKPYIEEAIEFLIFLSKKKHNLNINKKTLTFLCCK